MRKLYTRTTQLFLFGLFFFFAGVVLAQSYESVQSGPASDPTTWGGTLATDVPPQFRTPAATGNGDITISTGDTVTFDTDFIIPDADTLTVSSEAILTIINDRHDIDLDGNLICDGLLTLGTLFLENDCSVDIDGTLVVFTQLKQLGATNRISVSGIGKIYAVSINSAAITNTTDIEQITLFKTWTGTNSSDWLTTANWSDNSLPRATDRILIDPTTTNMPLISTNETVESFVLGVGDSLIIASNGDLTVDSFLVNNGTINIESNSTTASGNLFLGKPYQGNGTVNVQRYLPSADWHIISSPVNDTIDDFVGFPRGNNIEFNAGLSMYAFGPYDEGADDWHYLHVIDDAAVFNTELVAGKGYVTSISGAAAGTVLFSGNKINSGNISVGIDSTLYGWNGVGNPYTTSMSSDEFIFINSAKLPSSYSGLYLWNGITKDFEVQTTGPIAVGQGFVIRSNGTSSTVSFESSMQTIFSGATFKSAKRESPKISLLVQTGDLTNKTRITFDEESTDGLEPSFDVGKLKGNPNIALYSKLLDGTNDIHFEIQSLKDETFDTKIIPVGLDLKQESEVVFSLETVSFPNESKVFIEDIELGTKTLLNHENAEYKVTLSPSEGFGRFNLIVEDYTKSGQITTDLESIQDNEAAFKVYTRNQKIMVNGPIEKETQIMVFGIDGKRWYHNFTQSENEHIIDATTYPNGIYLVKVLKPGVNFTHKVVLTK